MWAVLLQYDHLQVEPFVAYNSGHLNCDAVSVVAGVYNESDWPSNRVALSYTRRGKHTARTLTLLRKTYFDRTLS